LFERSRLADGPNVPKPYILEPPVAPELERIAAGAPVRPPYIQESGGMLHNETPLTGLRGFSVGFTLLGQAAPLLDAVIELLSLSPLQIGASRFALDRVTGTAPNERRIWERGGIRQRAGEQRLGVVRSSGKSLRLSFVTPLRIRGRKGSYNRNPEEIAAQFWEAALVRAVRVRDYFCSSGSLGERLPWQDLPPRLPAVVRRRLFHYQLERLSNRQQRKMDFDGVVGSVWYEGAELEELSPLVYAAEVLHVGQKATFGLGRVKGAWTTD
jgi:hypothetical protein